MRSIFLAFVFQPPSNSLSPQYFSLSPHCKPEFAFSLKKSMRILLIPPALLTRKDRRRIEDPIQHFDRLEAQTKEWDWIIGSCWWVYVYIKMIRGEPFPEVIHIHTMQQFCNNKYSCSGNSCDTELDIAMLIIWEPQVRHFFLKISRHWKPFTFAAATLRYLFLEHVVK